VNAIINVSLYNPSFFTSTVYIKHFPIRTKTPQTLSKFVQDLCTIELNVRLWGSVICIGCSCADLHSGYTRNMLQQHAGYNSGHWSGLTFVLVDELVILCKAIWLLDRSKFKTQQRPISIVTIEKHQ
jgi:hypothetical protein